MARTSAAQRNEPIQAQPGIEADMVKEPKSEMRNYLAAGKLKGKVALISGGDSGIGRAVAIGMAKEGADIAIIHLKREQEDADKTRNLIEKEGSRCITLIGDIGDEKFCRKAVGKTVEEFGKLDILVNNAAEQHAQKNIEDISAEQLEKTFRTNIFGMFYLTGAAMAHLKEGAAIINTASITAFEGHEQLIDYSATKGAVVTFTRSLSQSLAKKGIRVNAVAPGPIWTPLIPASFGPEELAKFGKNTALGRPGQPDEVAPSFIFLASDDASYMTGQLLHPNGGSPI